MGSIIEVTELNVMSKQRRRTTTWTVLPFERRWTSFFHTWSFREEASVTFPWNF
jgi:hypothetical protein